jgi:predicted nucleic acid-binding protein
MSRRRLFSAQPGASLRVRRPVVVDAAVLAAVLFDEPEGPAALRELAGMSLHAPQLIDYEMASVALAKARAGLGDIAAQGLADYKVLALERAWVEPVAQASLAMSYRITSYDAAYLWLAAALQAPLITFDTKLARAARRHLGSDD